MITNKAIECGGIIFDENFEKLLVVYQKASKKWGLPKGHMTVNEIKNNDKLTCSKREIKEETGLNLNNIPNTILGKENMNNKLFYIYQLLYPINRLSLSPEDKNEILHVVWVNLNTIQNFVSQNSCNRSLREFNKRRPKLKKKLKNNIFPHQSNQFNILTAEA
jgi:ADP-ribose pyrophosphatase YjhB (NUDIX family)